MNSRIKLATALLAVASLAACADQPVQHMSGSQPVNNGYYPPANTAYAPPPPAPSDNGYVPPPQSNLPPPTANPGYVNGNNNAYNGNGNGYNNGNAQNGITYGTVERVDTIESKKDTGLGAVIGAGIGAIVGNQIGRSYNDSKTTGTVVGAGAGGLIGNGIERNQNKNNQLDRVYVRLDDGTERYWEMPATQASMQAGQRVRIQNDQLYTN